MSGFIEQANAALRGDTETLCKEIRRLTAELAAARAECERKDAALREAEELIGHANPIGWHSDVGQHVAWQTQACDLLDKIRAALYPAAPAVTRQETK